MRGYRSWDREIHTARVQVRWICGQGRICGGRDRLFTVVNELLVQPRIFAALCDQLSVLVYGEVIASGRPEAVRANREVQQAYLGEEVA